MESIDSLPDRPLPKSVVKELADSEAVRGAYSIQRPQMDVVTEILLVLDKSLVALAFDVTEGEWRVLEQQERPEDEQPDLRDGLREQMTNRLETYRKAHEAERRSYFEE